MNIDDSYYLGFFSFRSDTKDNPSIELKKNTASTEEQHLIEFIDEQFDRFWSCEKITGA
jgi:hypothetical protein